MKKLALTIAAASLVGFAGSALADPNDNSTTTGNVGKGNQGCDGTLWKNPGELNKFVNSLFGPPGQTVKGQQPDFTYGDDIDNRCGTPPS